MEIYRPIPEYSQYMVSNYGNVCRNGKQLAKHVHKQGYIKYRLYKDGVQKSFYAHRLVAEVFLGKVEGKNYVNHKTNVKSNNHVDNLEWCTFSENQRHAYSVIGKNMPKGAVHHNASAVMCLNNGKIYLTIKEAVDELNLHHSNIIKVCNGQRQHTKGFKFMYAL